MRLAQLLMACLAGNETDSLLILFLCFSVVCTHEGENWPVEPIQDPVENIEAAGPLLQDGLKDGLQGGPKDGPKDGLQDGFQADIDGKTLIAVADNEIDPTEEDIRQVNPLMFKRTINIKNHLFWE